MSKTGCCLHLASATDRTYSLAILNCKQIAFVLILQIHTQYLQMPRFIVDLLELM